MDATQSSLIPRTFYHSVFDCLQYAKMLPCSFLHAQEIKKLEAGMICRNEASSVSEELYCWHGRDLSEDKMKRA